jgi:hypothetical protein
MYNNNLSEKILNELKAKGSYRYSDNPSVKQHEMELVDTLELDGMIRINGRAVGVVFATVL